MRVLESSYTRSCVCGHGHVATSTVDTALRCEDDACPCRKFDPQEYGDVAVNLPSHKSEVDGFYDRSADHTARRSDRVQLQVAFEHDGLMHGRRWLALTIEEFWRLEGRR